MQVPHVDGAEFAMEAVPRVGCSYGVKGSGFRVQTKKGIIQGFYMVFGC